MDFKTKKDISWLTCDECEKEVDAAVLVGFKGTMKWHMCIACLAKATQGVFQGICKMENRR